MIGIVLALAAQAVSPQPQVPAQEIVITARRLKDWRGKVSASAKGSRCKTVRSTGDRDLDQTACDTLRFCSARLTPEIVAASKVARPARDTRLNEVNQRLAACGEEQQNLRVADLLERRALARINNAAN